MSKELEALERIKKVQEVNDYLEEETALIETALKEKETQDSAIKTLKEVIKFEQMLPHIEPNKDNGFDIMSAVGINIQRDIENKERELLRQWVLETCFPKELKALEIIKELILEDLVFDDKEQEINYSFGISTLCIKIKDKEKYDLLKEVLL